MESQQLTMSKDEAPPAESHHVPQVIDSSSNSAKSLSIVSTKDLDLSTSQSEHPSATTGEVLSKNQQKKLKRKRDWEESRDSRKARRKEKMKEKRERKRSGLKNAGDEESEQGQSFAALKSVHQRSQPRQRPIQVPLTIVFDCQYESLMTDNERTSLAGQITRSYSENRKSHLRAHLIVSSFGGQLKERYEVIQAGHYRSWQGIRFLEEDFVRAAEQAKAVMTGPEGGTVVGALTMNESGNSAGHSPNVEDGEVIYLSSDSPNVLSALKPYSTYIIGGLVDRNRHKGACYKKAMDANFKTAKLPIGEFLQLHSGMVLTTNHVCQIMLRWLELGDWGKAFMEVIPKRKGGMLKGGLEESVSDNRDSDRNQKEDEDEDVEFARDALDNDLTEGVELARDGLDNDLA